MPWTVYNSSGNILSSIALTDNSVTNAKVADDAIGVVELSATGTASSSTFLRGDNAWAAPGGGPSQANQTAIEAETNQDTYIPPDLIRYAPGIAKAWGHITYSTGTPTLQSNYNVGSITDNGVGDIIFNLTTAFSSANYSAQSTILTTNGEGSNVSQIATGTVRCYWWGVTGSPGATALKDPTGGFFVAFGDQ